MQYDRIISMMQKNNKTLIMNNIRFRIQINKKKVYKI